jgi:hypothetical protein
MVRHQQIGQDMLAGSSSDVRMGSKKNIGSVTIWPPLLEGNTSIAIKTNSEKLQFPMIINQIVPNSAS